MTAKCSKNLTRHISLLKQERDKLLTLHNNGYKVPLEDFTNYIKHKRYVTELLHKEKMESYSKILKNAR